VSSVTAGYSALAAGGLIHVTAQFEPADEGRVEAAILSEVRRIQDAGVTGEEMERAITASEAERVFAEETAEGLALAYGRAETTWSLEADRRYLDRIRAVTPQQVQEAARRYLSAPRARLTLAPKDAAR
jgi:zinc protease